jgi:hypothetical protein
MSAARIGVLVVLLLVLVPTAARAHEERLLVGRVETIDQTARLLVVVGAEGGERRRLDLTPETEVLACRAAAGLAALSAGGIVRVKYVEKAGSPSRAESILMLGSGR